MTRSAEDSWPIRWVIQGGAVSLAFASAGAVLLAHLIDRMRRR